MLARLAYIFLERLFFSVFLLRLALRTLRGAFFYALKVYFGNRTIRNGGYHD